MARPYTMTISRLLYELGLFLNDAKYVVVNVAGAATGVEFRTNMVVGGAANRYADSELFVWDIPTGATAANPWLISASDAATGILYLNQGPGPLTTTLWPQGTRANIQNFNGRGYPLAKKEQALRMAMIDHPGLDEATGTIAPAAQAGDFYALPAALRSVYRVFIADPTLGDVEIAPSVWLDNLDAAGRRIYLPYEWASGQTVKVQGRADIADWWTAAAYATVVSVNPADIIKEAVPWLLMMQRDDKAEQVVQNMYNDRLNLRRDVARANEVFLL